MRSKKLTALIIGLTVLTASTAGTLAYATTTSIEASTEVASLPSISDIGGAISESVKQALNNLTTVIKKYTTSYKELPTKYNVPKTKNFEVKFNREISFITVNSNTVKVVDSKGNEIPVKLTAKSTDKKVLIVEAPAGGYKEGETYALIIRKGISSLSSLRLVDETVMKFVIETSTTGGTTTQRDSMNTILKNYVDERVTMDKHVWDEHEWATELNTKGEYEARVTAFNKKYKNELYSDITDMDYYMKMPGLTVNFDKVNNINEVQATGSFGAVSTIIEQQSLNTKYDWNRYYNANNNLFIQYIWRPDVEKDMISQINAKRVQKGLKPLELSTDLTAIAKWASKRSYLGATYSQLYRNVDKGIISEANRTNVNPDEWYMNKKTDFYKEWIIGTTPYLSKDIVDIYPHDEVLAYQFENLEEKASEYFNYNKKIKLINQSSSLFYSAKDFLDYWESVKVLKTADHKVTIPKDIEKIIYDPNMEKIGVGSLYNAPRVLNGRNGLLGLYVILSE